MIVNARLRAVLAAASFGAAVFTAPAAHADSVASSASSAGSASSGSVSDSLQGSSNSSTGNNRRADGTYQILEVTPTPGRANSARVAMQLGEDDKQRIVLDLPQTVADQQALNKGMQVQVKNRDYGLEFARQDNRQAFFLVLADDVYKELAARKVTL
jgi:hypothetical protein